MQWAYLLLLVCVAVATAAPLLPISKPPPTKKPKLPYCADLTIDSELKQVGFTKGGAAISSSTSTQGSASSNCIVRTPKSLTTLTAVGNSGVSGSSASAGNGLFKQKVKAATEVKNTKEGVSVQTGTLGKGITTGTAVSNQNANANGGVNVKLISSALLKGKGGLAAIKKILQGTTTSSSGHKASGSGDSLLNVLNQSGTKILFDKLKTPKPPTTKAPKKKSG